MSRPTDPKLEGAVLGGVLMYPEAVDAIADLVVEDDFDDPHHRMVFRAMARLADRGGTWGLHDLESQLRSSEEWNSIGYAFLAKLTDAAAITRSELPRHAKRVSAIGQARRVWEVAKDTADRGAEILGDPDAWVARADAEHVAAMDRVEQNGPELVDLNATRHEVMRRRRGGGEGGIPTGISHYDRITGGLQGGTLIVIAARIRVGKSAMAMSVADFVAGTQGIPVLVFSLEMSRLQQELRLLAAQSGVDLAKLATGAIGDDDEGELERVAKRPLPLWIDDTANLSIVRAAARLRAWRRKHSAKKCLVIFDYLQLAESGTRQRGESREQEVAAISRALKRLSRRERIPVIALAQLNRGADKDDRPRLAHLRESGAIESDADIVWLLHRPEVEAKPEDKPKLKGLAELIVAKNRMGPEFTVRMRFDGPRAHFTEAAAKEAES